jgi:mRNA interferase MazF
MQNENRLLQKHMYQIVNFPFPFADNFDKAKPRPCLVISPAFGKHSQIILAYITTDSKNVLDTDILIDPSEHYFTATGLYVRSVIKLHRMITVTPSQIKESIGVLPDELIPELKMKLGKIFQLE